MADTGGNFEFLAKHDPLLPQLARAAERAFVPDPATTVIKLRQLGEAFARHAAASAGLYAGSEANQLDVLRDLERALIVEGRTKDLFHLLRREGNRAVHDFTADHKVALDQLKAARQLHLDSTQQAHVLFTALFGAGTLSEGDAVRFAADCLREAGLSDHKRLRIGGKLHAALEKAMGKGVRLGLLDRPARGHIRAIKPDAKDWTDEDWATVVAACPPNGDLDAWVREAAEWAREHCGLEFQRLRSGGHIDRTLRSAASTASS